MIEAGVDLSQKTFSWAHAGRTFAIPIARCGSGPTLLLLPALSSISTLDEMISLRDRLADRYATVAVDWPGFGTVGRPAFAWSPAAFKKYLDDVLDQCVPGPAATVAAGHAAAYLLDAAMRRPGVAGRLALIAPTWRGPLPTMMKRRSRLGETLAGIGDVPGLGRWLYALNVNRPMVRMMGRGHVYENPSWLTDGRLAAKMAVTRTPGARHAALRFVTGQLDPLATRDEFLALAGAVRDPMLVVYGVNSPKKSKAEMAALARLPNVASIVLPRGQLAVHEEEPDLVATAIRGFIGA